MPDRKSKDDTPFYFPSIIPKDAAESKPFRDLGTTPFAKKLGLLPEQTNGHWCSRCQGIWFGYTLEAECPACGNRHG